MAITDWAISRIKAFGGSSVGARDTSYIGASETSRELTGFDPGNGSADTDILPELKVMSGRSRDLDRNNPMASNIRVTKNDNVIGTGLQCQPTPNVRVLKEVLENDPEWVAEWGERGLFEWQKEWSKTTRAHWNDFCRSRFFDADGEDNFHMASVLMYDSKFLNGSGVAVPMWKPRTGTAYRTCIKIIEADRLCNPKHDIDTPKISGGVERNGSGEIVAYHVVNYHPGSAANDGLLDESWERIDAYSPQGRQRFIHVYDRTRPGQSRGIPAIANVITQFALQGKYQITELQAAIVNSNIAAVMETDKTDEEAAAMFGGKAKDYAKLRAKWDGRLTAGMILKLPPGTKLSSHIPNRPATAYVGFMEHVAREIGVGANLPFELSTRNFSKTNYSSARAALLEAWRHFKVERAAIAYQWANACYELWIEEAIFLGRVFAPGFAQYRAAYCDVRWVAQGQAAIDRLKDENANKVALENDTITLMEIAAEKGQDWEENAEQRFTEKAKALELRYRMAKIERELIEEHGEIVTPPEDVAPEPEPDPDPQSDEEIDEDDPEDEIPEEEEQVT